VKPVLAVDFDDVVFPFMDQFVPHYNDTYDASFVHDDYFTFEFHEVWGGTREAAFERVARFFHMPHDGIAPVAGSVEGVRALGQHFELVIVTARDESLRPHTEKWLDEAFPEAFSSVHLCNSYVLTPGVIRRSKLEVLEGLGAIGIIDDSVRTTSQVAASGRRALLFGNYAWNRCEQLPEGVRRFAEWQGIVESLVIAA
jgi:5'(3')-deoxyribonucleotidase